MEKIDFKKLLKHLYQPRTGEFSLVDVPAMNFLMVDGHGDPNVATAYIEAVEALYSVSYALKFMSKKELERDYAVNPLEGLWWSDDIQSFVDRRKDAWDWTMMIMQPDWITAEMVEQARSDAARKKTLPAFARLRFEAYDEGTSLQIMHVGSYDDEGPVLKRLHHEVMPAGGYIFNGKHHEIYIGDPRKTAPEKLKTVLRQPVKKG
jgi:hypothetical protein